MFFVHLYYIELRMNLLSDGEIVFIRHQLRNLIAKICFLASQSDWNLIASVLASGKRNQVFGCVSQVNRYQKLVQHTIYALFHIHYQLSFAQIQYTSVFHILYVSGFLTHSVIPCKIIIKTSIFQEIHYSMHFNILQSSMFLLPNL